ncbi:hypothetical protein B0O99DRAFT_689776 [Bisporella sp. PMI_857]|nr:hypothetical protein B0O99DRAFT_689776 [Bisporella sp. PMI_857]
MCIEFLKLLFPLNDQRCRIPEIIDIAGVNGCTALRVAIRRRYTKVVERLINAGADVNKPSYTDEYPLVLALQMENPEIVAMLLEAEAVGQPENAGDDPWQDDFYTFQAPVPNYFSEHSSYTWK